MKKIISTILVCVLLVGSVFTLASCNKIVSGTYNGKAMVDWVISDVTYEFGLFGNVTKTVVYPLGDTTVTDGKYKIYESAQNKLEIAFTWEGEEEEGDAKSFVIGTANGVDYIKIDGVQYDKVD